MPRWYLVGCPPWIASVVVAVALVCGGPNLIAAVRRRAERRIGS